MFSQLGSEHAYIQRDDGEQSQSHTSIVNGAGIGRHIMPPIIKHVGTLSLFLCIDKEEKTVWRIRYMKTNILLVTREDIARTRNNIGGVRESVTPILLEKNSTG